MKFFRRFRRGFLKTNELKKYFIYAIGEIILVVIGILIALQINTWNEKRKAVALGNEMVLEIQSGLESDLSELDRFFLMQQKVLNSQVIVSEWLKTSTPYHDSLSQHFSLTYLTTDFTINNAGYETLKKFGLRRIDNTPLRTAIADLYEIKYPSFIKFSDIYQNFLDELLANNARHFNELNYFSRRSMMHPLDVAKLRADAAYSYHLNTLKRFNQLLIYQSSLLKKEMNTTYAKFESIGE